VCIISIIVYNCVYYCDTCYIPAKKAEERRRVGSVLMTTEHWGVNLRYIGVVSVYIQYNCAYYCDTYIHTYTHLASLRLLCAMFALPVSNI
jgi:hypothetical protein